MEEVATISTNLNVDRAQFGTKKFWDAILQTLLKIVVENNQLVIRDNHQVLKVLQVHQAVHGNSNHNPTAHNLNNRHHQVKAVAGNCYYL